MLSARLKNELARTYQTQPLNKSTGNDKVYLFLVKLLGQKQ